MIGYANNGDFARVAAWFDLWPRAEGVNPTSGHPGAPVVPWHIDPTVEAPADYVTTELAVVGAWLALPEWASRARADVDTIDPWRLGLWRTLLLALAGVGVALVLRQVSAIAGALAAAVFAIVLCDPMVSLYLNTLYSEFSVALFGFATIGLALCMVALGPARPMLGAALALASFALGWSKIQFFALPVVIAALVVAGAIAFHRRALRSPVALAVLAAVVATGVAAAALQKRRIDRPGGYMAAARMCNVTDAYFGTFLPRLRDPAAGVRALRLPERCVAYVGRTWFDPGMDPPPCPELFDVPRFGGLVRLLALEPALAPRLLAGAVPLTRPFVYPVAQMSPHRAAYLARVRDLPSIAPWLDAVSPRAYAAAWAVALVGWCVALARLVRAARRPGPAAVPLLDVLVVVVGTVVAYALGSSVAGDGFADLAKHFFLGQLGLAVLVPASIAVLVRAVAQALPRRS